MRVGKKLFIMGFLKNYTTTVERSVTKTLFCEKCGKHLRYEVKRKARGYTENIAAFKDKESAARVLRQATDKSERRLATDISLVPCPHCHWYQRHMIRSEKIKRLRGMVIIGLVLGFIVLSWKRFKGPIPVPSFVPSVLQNYLFLFPAFLGILIGAIWYYAYNPNRGYKSDAKDI